MSKEEGVDRPVSVPYVDSNIEIDRFLHTHLHLLVASQVKEEHGANKILLHG